MTLVCQPGNGGGVRARFARAAAAWVVCAAACGGCTVNGRALLGADSRQYFENEARTGRSVMIDAWGINLSTVEGDAGLTVGRTRRTYFFPGPESAGPDGGGGEHLGGSGAGLRLATTRPFDVPSAPLAVRGRTEGLAVGAGMVGVRVTAGVQAFEALRLAPGRNVQLLIRARASRPDEDVFRVKEIQR